MSKKYFPTQGQKYTYLQTNRSDTLGSIWSSFGLDFQTDLNTLRLATRMLIATNSSDQPDMGLPIAFNFIDGFLWAIAGSIVLKNNTSPNAQWVPDTSTGYQTNYSAVSDMAIFNKRLWTTTATNLYSKAVNGSGTGAWTARNAAVSNPNTLTYFPVFNRLYFQDQVGRINSIDTSDVVATDAYILDLGTGTNISCVCANSTYIWAGVSATTTTQGSVAYIYAWDGISAAASKVYTLPTRYINAMCVYEDIVYCMDGNGILYKFNGYAFDEIGRLPNPVLQPSTNPLYIHRNGLIPTKNSTILALVSNTNSGSSATYQENLPSGVWEWSSEFGFTQKNLATYTYGNGSVIITDYGQNILSKVGALFNVSELFTNASGDNGTIVMGATYYTGSSSTANAIFVDDRNDTVRKKGYFVTTWFFSDEVQDKWTRLWIVFRKLLSGNDTIVFKYRTNEEAPLYADITWVTANSFTTTTNPTAYWTSGVGGEVEVLRGPGSGSCTHITNIVNNSGTYTVTVNIGVTGVSMGNTATVRFQKWIQLFPTVDGTDTPTLTWQQMAVGASNPRFQVKGCLTFTGAGEFYKMAVFSNEDIKVNA